MFAPSTRRSSDSLARGLPRLLSTLLVLGLLGGTAAAFAVTERLKLVPSPIIAPRVTPAFSPVCDCPTKEARIRFGLRDAHRLTVTVIDADSRPVRTIADDERFSAGRVEFVWDGRGAPEGVYRIRVHLADARRTIDIPNELRLDTTPPELDVQSIAPRVFSPDGDRNSDFARVRFSLSERSRVVLAADGKDVVRSTPRRAGDGKLEWYGRGAAEGPHPLVIVAHDSRGTARGDPHARPCPVDRARAAANGVCRRSPLRRRCLDRCRAVPLAARHRTGSSGARTLTLLSPALPGRYTLTVSLDGTRRDPRSS